MDCQFLNPTIVGMDAIMEHGGIMALLVLLNNGHLEAWSSATHTLHMMCSSTPDAAVMIIQAGEPPAATRTHPTCMCIVHQPVPVPLGTSVAGLDVLSVSNGMLLPAVIIAECRLFLGCYEASLYRHMLHCMP